MPAKHVLAHRGAPAEAKSPARRTVWRCTAPSAWLRAS